MKIDKNVLCIYHANCADGFGAAWAVRKALGNDVEFYPGVYSQPAPDVRGKHVVFVDFCYKPDVMDLLANVALSILVLDHHKSAMHEMLDGVRREHQIVDMSNWTNLVDWTRYVRNLFQDECENVSINQPIYCYFDMNRSGAMLAWNFFHPNTEAPTLIKHIQDRDLWRYYLKNTREIQAAVFSYIYDFDVWDQLMRMDVATLADEGKAIERKHFKDIHELLAVCQRTMVIDGHTVPVASLPYTMASDAGNIMAEGQPFAACYWDTPTARIFSLRSHEDGLDVSEVARKYGGGGHKHAAGFNVKRTHQLAES